MRRLNPKCVYIFHSNRNILFDVPKKRRAHTNAVATLSLVSSPMFIFPLFIEFCVTRPWINIIFHISRRASFLAIHRNNQNEHDMERDCRISTGFHIRALYKH